MADYLPPVIQEFIARVAEYVTPVLEATRAVSDFADENRTAALAVEAMGLAAGGVAQGLDEEARAAGDARTSLEEAGIAASSLSRRFTGLIGKSAALVTALKALDLELDAKKAALADVGGSAAVLAAAMRVLGDRTGAADRAAASAGNRWRLWGTGIRLTGAAIHWLIAGFAELMAVVIPATVAAGAWAAAWLQGTMNVARHLNAVYIATEAMANMGAKTAGQVLGLGNALQKAQDAANPNVYQALGGAINIVREHFSGLAETGRQVGLVFDRFVARLVYDMSAAGGAGGKLDHVLSAMIPDLVGLGRVFGNLGHALLNFASAMPGLAEVLLGIVAGITKLIEVASNLPAPLITAIFAFEEFNRWGGLLVNILGRMGIGMDALQGRMFSLARGRSVFMNLFNAIPRLVGAAGVAIGTLVGRLAGIVPAAGNAGAAIVRFGAQAEESAAGLGFLQAAAVTFGAIALGFLIYKLATARTAAQRLGDAMQQTVEKASNFSILRDVGANLSILAQKTAQATAEMRKNAAGAVYAGGVEGRLTNTVTQSQFAYQYAAKAVADYSAAQVQQIGDAAQTVKGAQQIASAYHISIPAAMALAQTAGVNLTHALKTQSGAWNALGLQVKDQVAGFQAMGQSGGVVGRDMLAVAIQSGLAASKVAQLNQAWDEFMANITGGTNALGGLETSLQNIGQVAARQSNNLDRSTKTMSLSTKQFANSLTHYTGTGAQAWQNFDQVIGSTMPQLADWLRTAGAEGAITSKKFNQAILDMSSQLIPFAKKSRTAQAELVAFAQSQGLNIKTFPELEKAVKAAHGNVADLGKIVGATTVKMGNMGQVAQNLGNVMNSALSSAISTASLKAAGFYKATNNLTTALQDYGAHSPQAEAAARAVTAAWNRAQAMAATVARKARDAQAAIDAMHGKNIDITTYYRQVGRGTGIGAPGGGPGSHSLGVSGTMQAAAGGNVTVHVHGSVVATQDIARAVQSGLNRKTIRNGSTQAFIPGRLH